MTLLTMFFGFITGLIDSVVGGGGLISLPYLSWLIAPGPEAIGTNKIVGTISALMALFVYAKKGHLNWKAGVLFSVVCALGSFVGSSTAPFIPKIYFRFLIIFICPIILYIVWNKDSFLKNKISDKPSSFLFISISAFASGFYDGIFGPGGGTFMFLSLYFFTNLNLLNSIAISKMANTFSAGTALITYAHNGYVHWLIGLTMAFGILFGSFIGATYNSKMDAKIIRPALTIVVLLLLSKMIFFK